MDTSGKGAIAPTEKHDSPELRKPHEMVVMVPRSGRMTYTGRKIYTALMQVSQDRMKAMDSMPPADYMFEAPLAGLLRTSGSSVNDRTAAKRYLREMRDLTVDWESTAPGDGVKWRGFSMLSEVAIEVRGGDNWVQWSFPPTIMAALRDPVRWARLELDVLAKLSSYAAIALYEICARYRDNPSGLTSRKPTAWWSDALSQTPPGSERREWRKIKSERVKPAIDEINEETDLEIELIEHRQGRSVTEVQFSVRKKRSVAPARKPEELVDASLVMRGESLGIREAKLEGLLKEFGEGLVRDKLTVLEGRLGNKKLSPIDNAFSYLRSLLRNHDPEEQASTTESAPRTVAALSGPAESSKAKPQPLLTEQEQWAEERRTVIRREIEALSPERKKMLIEEAMQYLASKGMMNAVLKRRADQGDMMHGMLGATVVRLYGMREYGPEWDKQRPGGDLFADQA